MTSAVPTTQPRRRFGTLKVVQPPAGLRVNEEVMLCHMAAQGERAAARLQETTDPATREWLKAGVVAGRRVRNLLVEWHLPLVKQIAAHYQSSVDKVDLEQEGYLALVEAASQHDYAAGQRFCVTAAYAIRQAIRKALRRNSEIVLPAQVQLDLKRLREVSVSLSHKLGRNPDAAEVAAALGVSPAKVANLQSIAELGHTLSLDLPTGNEDEGATLGELLPADALHQPLSEAQLAVLKAAVAALLEQLAAAERRLISLYHGLDGEEQHTYREMSKLVGISRETLRKRVHEAELKLATKENEAAVLPLLTLEVEEREQAEVSHADELRRAKRKLARRQADLTDAQAVASAVHAEAASARYLADQFTDWARRYERQQPAGRDRELRWQQAGYYTQLARAAAAETIAPDRVVAEAETRLMQAETGLKRLAVSIQQQYRCQCGGVGRHAVRLWTEWQPQNGVLSIPTRWYCDECSRSQWFGLLVRSNHAAQREMLEQTGDVTTRIYAAELKQWLPAQVYSKSPTCSNVVPASNSLTCYRCTEAVPRELAVDMVVQAQGVTSYRLLAICPACYQQVGATWQQRKESSGIAGIFDRYPAAPERKAGKRVWIKRHGYYPADEQEQASLIRVSRRQRAEWRKQEAEWLIARLDPYQRKLVADERKAEATQQQQRHEDAQQQQAWAKQQAADFWLTMLKYPKLLTRLFIASWLGQQATQAVSETDSCPTCGSHAGRRHELDLELTMLLCTFCEGITMMQAKMQATTMPVQPVTTLNCGRCHKAMAAGSRVLIWRAQQQCWLVRCAWCAAGYATYRQKRGKQQPTSNPTTQLPKLEGQGKVAGKRPALHNQQRK